MAAPYNPPIKNQDFVVRISLADMSTVGGFKAAPTIAAGDFKIDKDGAGLVNLATLPVVQPAGSVLVRITLSATEMNADVVTIVGIDQTSPKEWADFVLSIPTVTPGELAVPLSLDYDGTTYKSLILEHTAVTGGLIMEQRDGRTPFSLIGGYENNPGGRTLVIGGGAWGQKDVNTIVFYTDPVTTTAATADGGVERFAIGPQGDAVFYPGTSQSVFKDSNFVEWLIHKWVGNDYTFDVTFEPTGPPPGTQKDMAFAANGVIKWRMAFSAGSHLLPETTNTLDIGSASKFVRNLFTAGMRWLAGSAPASPTDGDMWFTGTALQIRIGGATKTVTVT